MMLLLLLNNGNQGQHPDENPAVLDGEAHRRNVDLNLDVVDRAVEELQLLAIRVHNGSPEGMVDDGPAPEVDLTQIRDSVEALRVELRAAIPNVQSIQREQSTLERIAGGLRHMFEEYGTKPVAGSLVVSIAAEQGLVGGLHDAIARAIEAVTGWLGYLQGLV